MHATLLTIYISIDNEKIFSTGMHMLCNWCKHKSAAPFWVAAGFQFEFELITGQAAIAD